MNSDSFLMNFSTLNELFIVTTPSKGRFVVLSRQSVTKLIALIDMNLVTPRLHLCHIHSKHNDICITTFCIMSVSILSLYTMAMAFCHSA
jgi:hypothetical protein